MLVTNLALHAIYIPYLVIWNIVTSYSNQIIVIYFNIQDSLNLNHIVQ